MLAVAHAARHEGHAQLRVGGEQLVDHAFEWSMGVTERFELFADEGSLDPTDLAAAYLRDDPDPLFGLFVDAANSTDKASRSVRVKVLCVRL